ncbi:MAG: hypothetical protein WC657_08215 [Candidatus Paceibacterota bacterium]|jgi:hypothetical protein
MAQTTGGMSANDMYVGVSTDGSTWYDVSGSVGSVLPSGGERQSGEAFTFDGNTPIVKYGKLGYMTVTLRGVYTPDADELYAKAIAAYEAGSAFYARWSPAGGDAGDIGYTTSVGTVVSHVYPGGEASTPDPILIEVVLHVGSITKSVIGTGANVWDAA